MKKGSVFMYALITLAVGSALALKTYNTVHTKSVTPTKQQQEDKEIADMVAVLGNTEKEFEAELGDANLENEAIEVKAVKVRTIIPDPTRTLVIEGEVGARTEQQAGQLLKLGQTKAPIYILINSPGGSVLSGALFISAMEAAKGPVYTVCTQLCASMAAAIFSYGSKRLMVDRSLVMFHPASTGGSRGELDKIVSFNRTLQRYVDKQFAYVAKRSGIKFKDFKALTGVEMWRDAEDSLELGLSDETVSVIYDYPQAVESVFSDRRGIFNRDLNTSNKVFDIIWK